MTRSDCFVPPSDTGSVPDKAQFQMLADQILAGEAWKKLRRNAKFSVSELVESALASHAERGAQKV